MKIFGFSLGDKKEDKLFDPQAYIRQHSLEDVDWASVKDAPAANKIEAIKRYNAKSVALALEKGTDEDQTLGTLNLKKTYGKRTVVDDVSIYLRQGEIVGLLGPNGAGKTTTFYMTVGLVQANAGQIVLNRTDMTGLPVYKRAQRGVGYLAQEASVFRKMTVEDNIKSILQMRDLTPKEQKEKLERLISEFNLEKVRHNLGDRLSGGERRRTEIARCLAIDPKFIMLDEPFAGVDPIAVEDIQGVVRQLRSENIGILITDHNAPETLKITDRAYLLFEGHILFQGTPQQLAANEEVKRRYLGRNFRLQGTD